MDENFRSRRNPGNNWLQDRAAMRRNETFSGIKGVNIEDFAVAESMGPIVDRSKEKLGASDAGIIAMRKLLLEAAAAARTRT